MTMYLLIGNEDNCTDFIAHTSTIANFTNYFCSEKPDKFALSFDINTAITGDEDGIRNVILTDYDGNMGSVTEGMYLFVINATDATPRIVDNIYFGGVITSIKEMLIAGIEYKQYEILASSFEKEASNLLVNLDTQVNIQAGTLINKIMSKSILYEGTVNNPDTRINSAKFNTDTTLVQACREIAKLYSDYIFSILPVLSTTQAGATYNFQEKTVTYAPFVLDDSKMEDLGLKNASITVNTNNYFNIINYQYYQLVFREPEIHMQITTTDNALLNSRIPIDGIPYDIDKTTIFVDDFANTVMPDSLIEADISNPYPPSDHSSGEGYIVGGSINNVQGLNLLAVPSNVYGEVSLVTDSQDIQILADDFFQSRMKEISISTLGNCICNSLYDDSTKQSQITIKTSSKIFTVSNISQLAINGQALAVDSLVTINGTTHKVTGISSNQITIATDATFIVGDYCELGLHNVQRVIYGLEFKSSGDLYIIQNGVSSDSGQNYAATIYTVRNQFTTYKTKITSVTSTTVFDVDSATGFVINDIVDVYCNGNNKEPVQRKVQNVSGATITLATALPATPSIEQFIETKVKARIEINGGAFGAASGRTWTTLGTMANTIQTVINDPRYIGVCLVMQKTIVANIKEFNLKVPPKIRVELYTGANWITVNVSTIDDSGESDVDAVIVNKDAKYFIEFFSDTKTWWQSGKQARLTYKEKRLTRLRMSNKQSMIEYADARGFALSSNITTQELERKGGIEAKLEDLSVTPLSTTDAFNIAKAILTERSKKKYLVLMDNLNNITDGLCSIGDTLIVSTSTLETELEIIEISMYQDVFGMIDNSGVPFWFYSITAGTKDNISDILKKASREKLVIKSNEEIFLQQESLQIDDNMTFLEEFYSIQGDITTYIHDGSSYNYIEFLNMQT